MQQQIASEGRASKRPLSAPRLGLRVTHDHSAAGVVELPASANHRIKVYTSAAVSGRCQAQSFLYTRGDVDVLPAGESDRWEQHDAASSLILELPAALLRRAAEDIGLDPARAGLAPRHQVRDSRIEHIAWALEAERVAGFPAGALFAESLGLGLAVHLLAAYRAPQRAPRGLSRQQLTRVTDYVEAHLDRDLSLARLAALSQLSVTHFKTLFRRSTGLSVHAYVVQRRVERARALLSQGRLPAAQIALEAGFAHQSHMARCMKRVLGIVPSALAR